MIGLQKDGLRLDLEPYIHFYQDLRMMVIFKWFLMKITKTYLISSLGKLVLDAEIERLKLLLNDASKVKGGSEDEFQNRE